MEKTGRKQKNLKTIKSVLSIRSLLKRSFSSIFNPHLALALFFFMILSIFASAGDIIVKSGNLNVSQDLLVNINTLYANSTSNRVGIGTTSPDELLQVGSETSTGNQYLRIVTDNAGSYTPGIKFGWGADDLARIDFPFDTRATDGFKMGTFASYPVGIYSNSVEAIHIDTSQQVGIGTSSPGTALEVAGTITSSGGIPLIFTNLGTGTYNKTVIYHDTTNGLYIDLAKPTGVVGGDPIDFQIDARGGGHDFFFINGSTGEVGIGTDSPTAKLHIVGADNSDLLYFDTDRDWKFHTTGSGASTDLRLKSIAGAKYFKITASDDDVVAAFLASPDANSQVSLVPAGGSVGIGGDDNSKKLWVEFADGDGDGNAVVGFENKETTAGRNYGMYLRGGSNADDYALRIINRGADELFYIRGDGNVGIGDTTPTALLNVGGDVLINAGPGAGYTLTFANDYGAVASAPNKIQLYTNYGFGVSASTLNIQSDVNTNFYEDVAGTPTLRMVLYGESVGMGAVIPANDLEVEDTSDTTVLRIQDSSNTCDFGVDGSGWASISCTSDEILKENITEVPESTLKNMANWIYNYPLKEYTIITNGERQIGVIAQEIQLLDSSKVTTMTEINSKTNETESYLAVQVPTNLDLLIAIQDLKSENELMKEELCKKDNSYGLC